MARRKRSVSLDGRTQDEVLVRGVDGDESDVGRWPKVDLIGAMDFSTDSLAPMVIGGAASSFATLVIRKYFGANTTVKKIAPVLGGVAGAVICVPIKWWLGDKAMYRGMLSSVLVGAGQQTYELMRDHTKLFSGIGMLVPERIAGLVMEHVGADLPMLPAGNSAIPTEVQNGIDISAYGSV